MNQRRVVRAIAYDFQEQEMKYLLLKTKKGYWQNPQGGIDENESEIEAIIRETKEETGLNIIEVFPNTRNFKEYDTERKGEIIHTLLSSYAVKIDSNQKVKLSNEDGHTDFKWVNYKDSLKLLNKYPEQKEVFESVIKKLNENYDQINKNIN